MGEVTCRTVSSFPWEGSQRQSRRKVGVHLHNVGPWKLKVLITLLILYGNEKLLVSKCSFLLSAWGETSRQATKGRFAVKIMLNSEGNVPGRLIVFHFS